MNENETPGDGTPAPVNNEAQRLDTPGYVPPSDGMVNNPNAGDPYSLIPGDRIGIASPNYPPKPDTTKGDVPRHPSAAGL